MRGVVARRWKVEELPTAVSMSRVSLSKRFKACAELPPLDYLIHWRILVAAKCLEFRTAGAAPTLQSQRRSSDTRKSWPHALPETMSTGPWSSQWLPCG